MLSGMMLKFKKFCRADERKKTLFHYCFLIFSHLQNFLKNGIDTHLIDLSRHQKFGKNSLTVSRKIGAPSWKYGKSHGRLDPTLHMPEVVHELNQVPMCAQPPHSIRMKKEIFFLLIVIWVMKKVTKISWGEFYRLHLH